MTDTHDNLWHDVHNSTVVVFGQNGRAIAAVFTFRPLRPIADVSAAFSGPADEVVSWAHAKACAMLTAWPVECPDHLARFEARH